MGLLDSAKAAADAARQAAEAARRAAEKAAANATRKAAEKLSAAAQEASKVGKAVSKKLTDVEEEVSGVRSSFVDKVKKSVIDGGALAAIDVGALKKTGSAAVGIDEEAIGKELAGKALSSPADVNKALAELDPEDRDDVAEELAGNLSDAQLEKLASTPDGQALLKQLRAELDDGPTWPGEEKQMARIDTALAAGTKATGEAAAKAHQLDPNPSTSINPTEVTIFGGGTKPLSAEQTARNAQVDALVDAASVRARTDAPSLVKDTQAAAAGMDPAHGGDLLARTADKLITAGKYDEAKALLKDLKAAPYAGVAIDLAGAKSGGAGQHEVPEKLPNGQPNPAAGTKVYFQQHVGIPGTFDSLAQTRLNQLDQLARMDQVLPASVPRPLNPTDITQVKAYFDELKKTKSMSEVGAEFQRYLTNFAKHPAGPETTWKAPTSTLTDAAGLTKVLSGAPRDASGRMLLDCEGQSYLAGAVFGGKGSTNDVWFTSGGGHISVSVFDAKTGKGFHVNTAAKDGVITELNDKPPAKTDEQRRNRAWNYHAHNGKPGLQPDFAPPTQVINNDRARAGRTPD